MLSYFYYSEWRLWILEEKAGRQMNLFRMLFQWFCGTFCQDSWFLDSNNSNKLQFSQKSCNTLHVQAEKHWNIPSILAGIAARRSGGHVMQRLKIGLMKWLARRILLINSPTFAWKIYVVCAYHFYASAGIVNSSWWKSLVLFMIHRWLHHSQIRHCGRIRWISRCRTPVPAIIK